VVSFIGNVRKAFEKKDEKVVEINASNTLLSEESISLSIPKKYTVEILTRIVQENDGKIDSLNIFLYRRFSLPPKTRKQIIEELITKGLIEDQNGYAKITRSGNKYLNSIK
jgi:predicted transcriptional regulator